MTIFGVQIFREKVKEFGPKPFWFAHYEDYIHIKPTLIGLLWDVITNYRHDSRLVG